MKLTYLVFIARHQLEAQSVERTRRSFEEDSYFGQNGELRWKSNNAVIGLDVFRDAYVEAPAHQKSEYDKYLSASLAEYRESMKNYQPSAEELFEMRSAFGAGAEVVNVITGQKIKV